MPKHDVELTSLATQVLAKKTERDKQVIVGASNFSNPCNRCLAGDLTGEKKVPTHAWLASVIGTAVHALMEDRLNNDPELNDLFGEPMVEAKLVLGNIEGYSTVKSSTDLYVPDRKLVIDWKTTTRKKLKSIEAAIDSPRDPDLYGPTVYKEMCATWFTLSKYLNQLHSYGRGLVLAGHEVERVALGFVCRDGLTENDIRVYSFDYDADQAERVWERVVTIWEMLTDGETPDSFSSHKDCWYCNNRR